MTASHNHGVPAAMPLRVLMVEDSADDAELLLAELRRGGYVPSWQRVDTAAALKAALDQQPFDLITCDWVMPQFSGPAALRLLRERRVEVPIIVVSGQVGEEFAVAATKAGAHDFVSKHNLARLCPAVGRELEEAEDRRARKRAEASLYVTQFAMDEVEDAVFMASPEGRLAYVNHAASQRLGYPREQLLRLYVWDIDPHHSAAAWPGYWASLKARGTMRFATRHRHADGTTFPVEVTAKYVQREDTEYACSFARLRPGTATDENRPAVSNLLGDVTEKTRIEESLRRSEEKFRLIFNNAHDALFILDEQGRFLEVNQVTCERLQYSREELLGMTVKDIDPPEFAARVEERIRQVVAAGAAVFETAHVRRDGLVIPVEVSSRAIVYEGRPALLSVVRDITERKRAEDRIRTLNEDLRQRSLKLEAANRELEMFSYSVSHDLRAPLRTVDGFSRLMLDRYADRLDGEGRHYLDRIRTGVTRMNQLVGDLLELSRISRNELRLQRVDLSAMVHAIAADLRAAQPHRTVDFQIAAGVYAEADTGLLRAAMENLLNNAWKYTSKHPSARIEFGVLRPDTTAGAPAVEARGSAGPHPAGPGATSGRRDVTYFVRDDGAGFDMEYVHKLFGAFQRLHSAEEFEGSGIGLATVQRIIARHGGRIWAEGAVEHGACFYFTLGTGAA